MEVALNVSGPCLISKRSLEDIWSLSVALVTAQPSLFDQRCPEQLLQTSSFYNINNKTNLGVIKLGQQFCQLDGWGSYREG